MLEPALLSSEVQMDSLQRRTTATHQVVKARGGLSSTDGGRTGPVSYKRSVQTSVDGKNNVIKPYKWRVEISGAMLNLLGMTQTQPWWRNDSAQTQLINSLESWMDVDSLKIQTQNWELAGIRLDNCYST